jgi:integrase/recombinase XerD
MNILLEDYLMFMKKRYPKSTAKTHLAAITKFLIINDRMINSKKLAMFLPEESKRGGERAITTKEIQKILSIAGTKRAKAIIHLFSATGSRPEALCNLKIKHMGQMPDNCKSLILYANSTHELVTFLHQEASHAIDEYFDERIKRGEYLKGESYVIGRETFIVNVTKPRPVTINSLESSLSHVMKRAGISRLKTGNRYDLAICGGFRKRFDTILKINPNISYAIAEMMMDHKIRMEGHYFKPSKEQLFDEYKKAIPELTIDDSERLKIKNEQQSKKISELEVTKEEFEDMKREIRLLKKYNKH